MFQEDGSSSVTSSSPLQLFSMVSPPQPSLNQSSIPWLRELKSEERGLYLIHLLLTCGNHVANNSLDSANIALEQIAQLASPDGDTMQRIAAYFTEALAHRILKAWPGLHKAINSTRISFVSEDILVRKLFFEIFPFLRVAFVLTNQAIIEAMEEEKMVHIIDLNAAEPAQWIALLQDLSARPEGPPHLRITGRHERKEVLDQMAHRLSEEAEKLDIPFQFNSIVCKLENLDIDKLRVKTGEALAICSTLQLHTLLASDDELLRKRSPLVMKNSNGNIHLQRVLQMNQTTLGDLTEKDLGIRYSPTTDSASSSAVSPDTTLKMDSFLNSLWSLSPKLMMVTEQDSNHNGTTLMERLLEALYTYAALFDCLESTMPRTSIERVKVEKMLLGEEIKNIISCEGGERKERHEKLEKWIQRLDVAGFDNVPLSYGGLLQAKRLLQGYKCDGYKIKDENRCVLICWQDRPLFSVSAWRCRK